ncbi:MAG TPA: CHAP domain-containing protein [Ktedonobacterales bacterium]
MSLIVAGALATGLTSLAAPAAHASAGLHYQRGYSVQHGWLCYGWASGAYHCTHNWHRSGNRLISGNPGWVPNSGGGATTTARRTYATSTHPTYSFAAFYSSAPSGISQWAWTGHGSYTEPYGVYQGYSWGWCTSGAAMMAHDYVGGLGYAANWTRNAAARGMATGWTPRAGATVVFQPGVQGASGEGHVAHVVAVYSNGWFLVAETAFWLNGGGFGRVSYRYAHAGAGVSFIY